MSVSIGIEKDAHTLTDAYRPTDRLTIALTNTVKETTPTSDALAGHRAQQHPYGARFCAQADGMLHHFDRHWAANVKPQPKNFSQRELAANPTPRIRRKLFRLTARLDARPRDGPRQRVPHRQGQNEGDMTT
jgi:hypothetical protein